MSRISRDQIRKLLDEAEGYLMLDLPARSLQILDSRPDWLTMQFEANFLKGEALRSLNRYREALKPLEIAASLRPSDTRVALALGWCYKRTNRLAQAIDSLERALRDASRRAPAALQPGLLLEPGRQQLQGARRARRPRWISIRISAPSSPRNRISTISAATRSSIASSGLRAVDLRSRTESHRLDSHSRA